jgi:UDPglucose 6-dehydrogenase
MSQEAVSNLCIVGTGYVGTANAIGFAELGHRVVGFDIISERVRSLAQGVPPYTERDLAGALREQLDSGRLRFTENLGEAIAGAKFIVIAVGTPTSENGSPDLSALAAVSAELETCDLAGKIVVVRSTVPPGTTVALGDRLPDGIPVVFAPEFLREGLALHDFRNPSRIVIGALDEAAARAFAGLHRGMQSPVFYTSPTEAEVVKGFSNAFLATKISFANEVANFCDAVGADARAVLAAVGADPRIGTACLAPGIGFGGPCLSKDVRSLEHCAQEAGAPAEMLAASLRVNESQPGRVIAMLERELGDVEGTTIGVWGLTFKAGTDDVRNSLAVRIVNDLVARGARVRAFDPSVSGRHLLLKCEILPSAVDALDADALLVLTDWPEFRDVAPEVIAKRLLRPIVIDGRNVLDREALVGLGIAYRSVGRSLYGASVPAGARSSMRGSSLRSKAR